MLNEMVRAKAATAAMCAAALLLGFAAGDASAKAPTEASVYFNPFCESCAKEAPRVAGELRRLRADRVRGIGFRTGTKASRAFARKMKWHLYVFGDPGGRRAAADGVYEPTVIVLKRSGRIVRKIHVRYPGEPNYPPAPRAVAAASRVPSSRELDRRVASCLKHARSARTRSACRSQDRKRRLSACLRRAKGHTAKRRACRRAYAPAAKKPAPTAKEPAVSFVPRVVALSEPVASAAGAAQGKTTILRYVDLAPDDGDDITDFSNFADSAERDSSVVAMAFTCATRAQASAALVKAHKMDNSGYTGLLQVDERPNCHADYDARMGGITQIGHTRLWATDGKPLALYLPVEKALDAGRVILPTWSGINPDWQMSNLAVTVQSNIIPVKDMQEAYSSQLFAGPVAAQSFYEACPSCVSDRVASLGTWSSANPDKKLVGVTCGDPQMAARFVYERSWTFPVVAYAGDLNVDDCWMKQHFPRGFDYTSDQVYFVNGVNERIWPRPYQSCTFRGITTPWENSSWESWKPPTLKNCQNLDGTRGAPSP